METISDTEEMAADPGASAEAIADRIRGPQKLCLPSRLGLIALVFALHVFVWQVVNHINAARPVVELKDLSVQPDAWIPYLGWTWPAYYSAHFYITFGGSLIVWQLRRKDFIKIILTIAIMIIAAGGIQLIIPARSPLPSTMNEIHRWFHSHLFDDPFVCFPSMHVALTLLVSLVGLKHFKGIMIRTFICLIAVLISISTVTLKEHYLIDSVAGGVFALIFFCIYDTRLIKSARIISTTTH